MENEALLWEQHLAETVENGVCPNFVVAMDVIGHRWTALIIAGIGREGAGFAEIGRFVGGIGDTMLAKRLRELENDGLVVREVMDTRPTRVQYHLTERGGELLPILEQIAVWGHRYSAAEGERALMTESTR